MTFHSPGENLAGTTPSRTFPDLAQILAGNTNAATGALPGAGGGRHGAGDRPGAELLLGVPADERLRRQPDLTPGAALPADRARRVHRRTPRRTTPAGVSWGDIALTLDPTAGPFLVTSQAAAGTVPASRHVTWDVAGTNTASMAQNVRISLSTDGG